MRLGHLRPLTVSWFRRGRRNQGMKFLTLFHGWMENTNKAAKNPQGTNFRRNMMWCGGDQSEEMASETVKIVLSRSFTFICSVLVFVRAIGRRVGTQDSHYCWTWATAILAMMPQWGVAVAFASSGWILVSIWMINGLPYSSVLRRPRLSVDLRLLFAASIFSW